MLPGSGSQWERGLRYAGSGVEERITTEEARRAVPKERGQRDQRGRSGVPAYRMTRGGVGPGCAYIHIDQSIKEARCRLSFGSFCCFCFLLLLLDASFLKCL